MSITDIQLSCNNVVLHILTTCIALVPLLSNITYHIKEIMTVGRAVRLLTQVHHLPTISSSFTSVAEVCATHHKSMYIFVCHYKLTHITCAPVLDGGIQFMYKSSDIEPQKLLWLHSPKRTHIMHTSIIHQLANYAANGLCQTDKELFTHTLSQQNIY